MLLFKLPDWFNELSRINKILKWLEKNTSRYKEIAEITRQQLEKLSYINNKINYPVIEINNVMNKYLISQNQFQNAAGHILKQNEKWLEEYDRLNNITNSLKPKIRSVNNVWANINNYSENIKKVRKNIKLINNIRDKWESVFHQFSSNYGHYPNIYETIDKFNNLWERLVPNDFYEPDYQILNSGEIKINGATVTIDQIKTRLDDITAELETSDNPDNFFYRLENYLNSIPSKIIKCIIVFIIYPYFYDLYIGPRVIDLFDHVESDKNKIVKKTKNKINNIGNQDETNKVGFTIDFSANVYASNSQESSTIGKIPILQMFYVLDTVDGWVKIKYPLESDTDDYIIGWVTHNSIIF